LPGRDFQQRRRRHTPRPAIALRSAYGNPTVNDVQTYETLNATLRTLALDSNGVLYKEATPGTLSSIASGLATNAYANSTTLFGREYLATSDGKTGNDLPRQYDDTNFDRVSQSGPGAGPAVVDENVIVSIAASPNGATGNGFLVTITTTTAHGLSAGQSVPPRTGQPAAASAPSSPTFPSVHRISSAGFSASLARAASASAKTG